MFYLPLNFNFTKVRNSKPNHQRHGDSSILDTLMSSMVFLESISNLECSWYMGGWKVQKRTVPMKRDSIWRKPRYKPFIDDKQTVGLARHGMPRQHSKPFKLHANNTKREQSKQKGDWAGHGMMVPVCANSVGHKLNQRNIR
jgi:hypothetical protein